MYEDSNLTRPSRSRFLPYIFGGITGVSVALVILVVMLLQRNTNGETLEPEPATYQAASTVSPSKQIDVERRNAIVNATEQVSPAVINIMGLYRVRTRSYYDIWFNRFYPGQVRTQATQGSGFIIDKRGYAFTNYHVVRDAERIQVTLSDGKEYAANLVGVAPTYDLALLKLDGDEFPAARLGDSDDLVIGEWAIAIGSPFGSYLADTQPTVTVGVISANHRDIKQDENSEQIFNDMIQTDAAINPGNSGGPLINARGEVIGVNTLIFSGTTGGGSVGIGFAIPINRVRKVYEEIVEYGRVRDVWVGMAAVDITPQMQSALNLPSESGVLVQSIEDGGPADKAGLKPGDQIVAINGVKLQNRTHANRLIFGSGVGDTIEMTLNRKDKLLNVKITLAERPRDI